MPTLHITYPNLCAVKYFSSDIFVADRISIRTTTVEWLYRVDYSTGIILLKMSTMTEVTQNLIVTRFD